MKALFLECNAGASGDMLLGALTGLLDDPDEFKQMIMNAGIPDVSVEVENGTSNGICGLSVHIRINGEEEGHEHHTEHHHEHHRLSDVLNIINNLKISDKVKKDATEVYKCIADAESKIHGMPVDMVHFHEVGALDAVADIVGTCMLIEKLSPEKIISSPVRTGYGEVSCAHGLLPIPAPATAIILSGIPCYAGNEEGEFTTPTGAALVKHFADEFQHMPALLFDKIGTGVGSRIFKTANILRAYMGEVKTDPPSIKEIKCNVDDMSPEDMGRMIDLLLSEGALDAFIAPCIMKKGRPGFELTCLSRPKDTDSLAKLILLNTSTIGLRIHDCDRYAMSSEFKLVQTEYGSVRVKVSHGFGIEKHKAEYEDLLKASKEHQVPTETVRIAVEKAFKE